MSENKRREMMNNLAWYKEKVNVYILYWMNDNIGCEK